MKSPLKVGALAAPKRQFSLKPGRPRSGKARRIASLSAAAAVVLGVGAASALFVDYLADRALARAADDPVAAKPVVAAAIETAVETKVASIAASPAPEVAMEPAAAPIEASMPEPEAIAKVAVGPEHAIELPTDDPTAKPIVKVAAVAPEDDEPLAFADDAPGDEPLAEDASDETRTAAIAPDEAQAAPKPKRKAAEAAPAETRDTEVASLPGVDVGGLAGHPSSQSDEPESTVRTVTKPAQAASRNLGGVPAGAARVTAAVNMRSAPKKGASVLTVVPAGSAVNVMSCNGWCQIDYNGRKGFVYKSFARASRSPRLN